MFDIGFWELSIIAAIGLLVLGPERLPRVAQQVGRWVARAKNMASGLQKQLSSEIAEAEKPMKAIEAEIEKESSLQD